MNNITDIWLCTMNNIVAAELVSMHKNSLLTIILLYYEKISVSALPI